MDRTTFPIQFKSSAFYVVAVIQGLMSLVAIFGLARGGERYLGVVLAVAAPLTVLFFALGYAINHLRVTSAERFSLGSPLREKSYPLSSINGAKARLIDLGGDSELSPSTRTNGLQLGNLRYGWFRLRNGNKALVAVTRTSEVVHIPTTNGFDILVTPVDANALVEKLRGQAGTATASSS